MKAGAQDSDKERNRERFSFPPTLYLIPLSPQLPNEKVWGVERERYRGFAATMGRWRKLSCQFNTPFPKCSGDLAPRRAITRKVS